MYNLIIILILILIFLANLMIICLNKVDYFFVQNRQKSKNVKNQKLSKKTKPLQRTVLKLSPVLRRSPNKTKKTLWQLCSEKCLRIGAIFSQQQFCWVFLRSADTPIFDQTKTLFWLFPNRFPNRFNFTKEQKEEEEEEVEILFQCYQLVALHQMLR